MTLHAGNVIPGQLYVWTGYQTILNEYTRSQPTPLDLYVSPKTLECRDMFVPLEVIVIDNKQFDLKVLTAKGDMGYLFRWYMEGVPARMVLSSNDILY